MKRIKLSFAEHNTSLLKQTPGRSAVWGDYHFLINQDVAECDGWVVCDHLPLSEEKTVCPKNNVLLVTSEPYPIWRYDKKFVRQFAKVLTSQRQIKAPEIIYSSQGHGWHIGLNNFRPEVSLYEKSYDELMAMTEVPKTKTLSIITSNKQYSIGHRRRYNFALALKKALGDKIDLFGRGVKDFEDKWDVLAPYRYSIAIENCSTPDYISEKLTDCFLSHSFPFYYGAPNIDKYYEADAYCLIDINNLDESVEKIRKIINDPEHYQKHLDAVKRAKVKYLNHYQLFPLLANLIDNWSFDVPKEKMVIHNPSNNFSWANRRRVIGNRLGLLYDKIISRYRL